MAHERQDIRTAIVARLIAASTGAGSRVSTQRGRPLRKAGLPAILVYSDSEKVSEGSAETSPRELKRTAVFAVEAWVTAEASVLEDAMDAIALEIETALDQDLNLAHPSTPAVPLAFDSVLIGTEFGVDPDGELPMGCVHLEYAITYHSDLRLAAPTDLFDQLEATTSLGGDQAALDQSGISITGINQE
jgi:hypothetical protein